MLFIKHNNQFLKASYRKYTEINNHFCRTNKRLQGREEEKCVADAGVGEHGGRKLDFACFSSKPDSV